MTEKGALSMTGTKPTPWLAALVVGFTMLGWGCGLAGRVEAPQREPMFGAGVDSVVVLPFTVAEGSPVSARDVSVLGQQLAAELAARPHLKIFEKAPTDLPNTITVAPRLILAQRREVSGTDFLLREYHLRVQMTVRRSGTEEPAKVIRRSYSYQKVVLADEEKPQPGETLRVIAGELAEQLAEALYPETGAEPFDLDTALDFSTGKAFARARLLLGNSLAEGNSFDMASNLWRLVLFEPIEEKDDETLFLLSARSLELLRQQGVEDEAVTALEAMMTDDPEELIEFRDRVRIVLGGVTEEEGKILVIAKFEDEVIHRNLTAAHANLGAVALFDKRYDIAAFHTARAYLTYPSPERLEKWAEIQRKRNMIPGDLSDEAAMRFYARLPPPRGVVWKPGSRDRKMIPGGVIEPMPPPPPPDEEAAGPETAQAQSLPLQPIERSPVADPGPGGAENDLPPIQNLRQQGN
ncbi:MAG: hypothetical protein V3S29_12605 [bacterium]